MNNIITQEEQFVLLEDGKEFYRGNNFDCLLKLQKSQPQSYDYATKYGGWKIIPLNQHIKNSPTEEDQKFEYQLLARLRMDCDYYLGHGNQSLKNLYHDTVHEHISAMKKIWNLLTFKPEWISLEQILDYEKRMKL